MAHKNISKIPSGYVVQIYRSDIGHHIKRFTVASCGTRRKALTAAIAHRDEMLKTLPTPAHVGPIGTAQRFLRTNNTSGVAGVTPRFKDGEHVAWVATWRQDIDGERKQRHKEFRFKTDGGCDAAFRKAVKYRRRMEREHYQQIITTRKAA